MFEALIAKGAGEENLFARVKEAERLRERLVELARRPSPSGRVVLKQPGAVAQPAVLFELLQMPDPALNYSDLGLLVVVAVSLENRRSVFPGGRVEGDDERVLIMPRGAPTGYHEAPGCPLDVSRTLKRLAKNELVTFTEENGERRVGFGPRLLEAWEAPEA